MKRGCVNCKYRSCSVTRAPCNNCAMSGDKYSEWTAQTNADKIRSMTDEELAKYLAWLVDDEFPPCCEWEMYGDTIQINAWLEWLEEEVKE